MYRRTVEGRELDFGVSGLLRFSNLVIYDRQTESWWQQVGEEAVVGELTGTRLVPVASQMVSWAEFRSARSDGKVLSRETGYSRPYGRNPYAGYDSAETPFIRGLGADERLPLMERVVGVEVGGEAIAFPFSALREEKVVHATVAGEEIVVLWKRGTASALDGGAVAEGRGVGATGVFRPTVGGTVLTLRPADHVFVDEQTGTTWNLLGEALEGPLEGEMLEPVVHANHLWFSWSVFRPDTGVYEAR